MPGVEFPILIRLSVASLTYRLHITSSGDNFGPKCAYLRLGDGKVEGRVPMLVLRVDLQRVVAGSIAVLQNGEQRGVVAVAHHHMQRHLDEAQQEREDG